MNLTRRLYPFACAALVALAGLAFAVLPLLRGRLFFYWDNAHQHYAQTKFLHNALRSEGIPHWWPHVGSGTPVVAEGVAAHFHPIRLVLAWLLQPHEAMMIEIGLCLATAGLGVFLFLREFRIHPLCCVMGAFCQMFGSFSVVFVRNMALHRSICLFPLAMWLADRWVSRKRGGAVFGISLIVALQFLAGHPPLALITALATTVYIVCRELQRMWRNGTSLRQAVAATAWTAGGWVLLIALGMGIAAIQVIPTLKHTEYSMRRGGLNYHYAARAVATRAADLPMVLLPYAYTQGDWIEGTETTTLWDNTFNPVPGSGFYLGALPVGAAIIAVCWRRRWADRTLTLTISGLLSLGFALGSKTPLFAMVWNLPGLSGLRYPGRFLMWTCFCGACLGALGLHRALARASLKRHSLRDWIPFAALAVVLLVLAMRFYRQDAGLRHGILISLALFGASALLLAAVSRSARNWRTILLIAAVTLTAGDLWLFRKMGNYAREVGLEEATTPSSLARFLQNDPDKFRVLSLQPYEQGSNRNESLREFVHADTCTIWNIESADVSLSLLLKRYHALREGIVWQLLRHPETASKLAGLLGAMNIRYVVAPPSLTLSGWEQRFTTPVSITWKNPEFLPKAYLVGQTTPESIEIRDEWYFRGGQRLENYREMVSDWGSRIEDSVILDNLFANPVDFRSTAVLAAKSPPILAALDSAASVKPGRQGSDSMQFTVDTRNPALLVVSSNFYPGWSATVNGKSAPIYRANWFAMGIPVPPGINEVVLRFVTPGFRQGIVISVLSLSGWGFLLWFFHRRQVPHRAHGVARNPR